MGKLEKGQWEKPQQKPVRAARRPRVVGESRTLILHQMPDHRGPFSLPRALQSWQSPHVHNKLQRVTAQVRSNYLGLLGIHGLTKRSMVFWLCMVATVFFSRRLDTSLSHAGACRINQGWCTLRSRQPQTCRRPVKSDWAGRLVHWATPWGSNADAILPEICLFSLLLSPWARRLGGRRYRFKRWVTPGGRVAAILKKLNPR